MWIVILIISINIVDNIVLWNSNVNYNLIFHSDTVNFNSKCSLDKYLKQWGASSTKMIFPYERYHCISQMKQEIEFPPYAAFYSTLKRSNVDRDVYDEALKEYNRRRSLPDDSPQKYNSMADYLKVWSSFFSKVNFRNIILMMSSLTWKQSEKHSRIFNDTSMLSHRDFYLFPALRYTHCSKWLIRSVRLL